jgi:DNA-binding protein H-NS
MERRKGGRRVSQFSDMTIDELIDLHQRIDQLIDQTISTEKLALRQKLARIEQYERHNRLDQPAAEARHSRKRVRAKYRNPHSGETWRGRGKLPRWMVALIEQGANREDFRID